MQQPGALKQKKIHPPQKKKNFHSKKKIFILTRKNTNFLDEKNIFRLKK